MKTPIQKRQGDILLEQVATLPADTKPVKAENGRLILARGEATGHHHSVAESDAELVATPSNELFLLVKEGTKLLEHQEHGAVELQGKNVAIRQREYSPEAIRPVGD